MARCGHLILLLCRATSGHSRTDVQMVSEADTDQPERRFAESALYSEGCLVNGHAAIWGSWYDASRHRWGYACCRGVEKTAVCSAVSAAGGCGEGDASASAKPCRMNGQVAVSRATDSAGSELHLEVIPAADGMAPPGQRAAGLAGLPSRAESRGPEDFVLGWARAVLEEWHAGLQSGDTRLVSNPRFGTPEQLAETERDLAPLLRILESCSSALYRGEGVRVWSVGNNKWMRDGKVLEILPYDAIVRGSLTPADGMQLPVGSVLVSFDGGDGRKWVQPDQLENMLRKVKRGRLSPSALEKIEQIAQLSLERRYDAANQAYMDLTLGHGRWHGEVNITGMTGCAKAPRNGLAVRSDRTNILDTDEAKGYVFGLKRLVALLEAMKPG